MRILVAYDGSQSSEAAIDQILAMPWPKATHVRLVTVVERPMAVPPTTGVEVFTPVVERIRATLREEAHQKIQQALQKFASRPEIDTSYELCEGSPKHSLLDAVRDWQADLVIAGSHEKGPVARLLLGSVSLALVSHAPCTVMIVKSHAGQHQ